MTSPEEVEGDSAGEEKLVGELLRLLRKEEAEDHLDVREVCAIMIKKSMCLASWVTTDRWAIQALLARH